MSNLRSLLTVPLSLLVFLIGLSAWAQTPFSYRLGELRQLATEVQRLSQAIEQETRYSYRSGLGIEASQLARQADYFRSTLDSYQFNEFQARSDFQLLVRDYRQVIAYEGTIYGNYQLQRLLSDLRSTVDRLSLIFTIQSQGSIFAHRQVIRLANRIDHNATALFRSVEQDLSRFGRLGYAERESIKSLLDLAIAARHLESQVTRLFQDPQHTRRDADELGRKFQHAEAQLAYLPLSSQSREALSSLAFDINELQGLYGVGSHDPHHPRDPYSDNDPFGRGGISVPVPVPGTGPMPFPGDYSYDHSYGNGGNGHGDVFNPCLDPYLCGGGPVRGGAPSVRGGF